MRPLLAHGLQLYHPSAGTNSSSFQIAASCPRRLGQRHAVQPISCASLESRIDRLLRQAVHGRPRRPPVRGIRREVFALDGPMVLSDQRPDDGGQRGFAIGEDALKASHVFGREQNGEYMRPDRAWAFGKSWLQFHRSSRELSIRRFSMPDWFASGAARYASVAPSAFQNAYNCIGHALVCARTEKKAAAVETTAAARE